MMVAVDLDGTLVPPGSTRIGRYTAEVLARADRAGVHVVFVTARPLRWMDPLWPYVGRHGMAVVSNGAIVYDVRERDIITTHGIEPAHGLHLAEAITASAPETAFAIECVDGIRLDPWFTDDHEVPAGSPRGPLAQVWDVPAVKLLVRNHTFDDDEFRQLVTTTVGDTAVATWSGPGLVEASARVLGGNRHRAPHDDD